MFHSDKNLVSLGAHVHVLCVRRCSGTCPILAPLLAWISLLQYDHLVFLSHSCSFIFLVSVSFPSYFFLHVWYNTVQYIITRSIWLSSIAVTCYNYYFSVAYSRESSHIQSPKFFDILNARICFFFLALQKRGQKYLFSIPYHPHLCNSACRVTVTSRLIIFKSPSPPPIQRTSQYTSITITTQPAHNNGWDTLVVHRP